ncbi:uncharacterized protein LOC126838941 [Adelges cooleyi]|uniref:uncharacterized protein LOC126838941 n=1 Tax=Adelges cooleyi TaxID=133065 RepID=UPI0021804A4C|nr:uncharacterized protein LOC126838941 [Adelges cooleyi]
MAKVPGESKIPVLNSSVPLRSRFSNISNKVRSHFDGSSYRNSSTTSTLFGLFNGGGGTDMTLKSQSAAPPQPQPQPPPNRPSSLFKPANRVSVTEKDLGSLVELTQHSKTGVLRYFGKTVLGPGDWCGVEVEPGHGVCDGSVCGVRYFACRDQCALFVLAHLVRLPAESSRQPPHIVVVGDSGGKLEAELMYDDDGGSPAAMANCCWDLDIRKTESPFEGTDSLGILTPDQMVEFKGDEAHYEVPGIFFKMSPHQITECISEGDIVMSDLEMISMPKDDDLVSPVLSSDPPSNPTVSEQDSAASTAYPKRSTVSFGHVFYDNVIIDRTPSLEDLPMDDFSSRTTTEVKASSTIDPPNVVLTSITSVGSLDTGYQGDGETSRPTSRGATAVKRTDGGGPTEPMTDSDFFTESEAEDHCHRKARVIDGTLYSGDVAKQQESSNGSTAAAVPAPATIEEMDSSGVYSDFDRIFEEPATTAAQPENPEGAAVSSSNTQSSTSPSSINSLLVVLPAAAAAAAATTDCCAEDASSPASKRYKRPPTTAVQKPKTLDLCQDQENRAPRARKPAGRWDAVMNKIEKSKVDQKTHANRLKDVKSKINTVNPLNNNRLKESPTNTEPPLPTNTHRSHRLNTPLKAKSRKTRARGGSESNLPITNDHQPNAASRPRCIPKSSQNSSRDSSFSDLSSETKIALKQATSHPTLVHKNFNSRSAVNNAAAVTNASTSVRAAKPVVHTTPKGPSKTKRINTEHNLLVAKPSEGRGGSTTAPHVNNGKAPASAAATAKVPATIPTTAPVVAAAAAQHKPPQTTVLAQNKRNDALSRQRAVEARLLHATKGFEAFAIFANYLVNEMDAMSTTILKQQLQDSKKDLLSTKSALEESQAKCEQYQKEIDKLQEEIEKYQSCLQDKDKLIDNVTCQKNTEIIGLEEKIHKQANDLRLQFDEQLTRVKNDAEEEKMKLILCHDQQIVALQQTNKLDLCQLQKTALEKETVLDERVKSLECERDQIKSEKDQLTEENQRLIEARKLENPSLGYQKLCDEAESLRTVLELRSSEMQELRKQNEKLQREVEELPAILQKLEAAQTRVEDLNVQLQRKAEIEMQLSLERDKMAREIDLEKQKKKRLSCHNEELQWKLKKSTEVANHLAVSTKRLSQTPQDLAAMKEAQNNFMKLCKGSSNSENSGDEDDDDTMTSQFEVDHLEAPAKIMGVMKKNDSLSYVFEVEEEPSEIATRMVRRASSLRSVGKARTRNRDSIGEKRSRANSQSVSKKKSVDLDTTYTGGNLDDVFGPSNSDICMSDCFTCSSDSSSNSSPEHNGYDPKNRMASYIVNNKPTADRKTKSNGLTI